MTVQIECPEEILRQLGWTPKDFDLEMRLLLAARLYSKGIVSTGKAAELMDVPRSLLLSRLADFGVVFLNLNEDELADEAANAS